MAASRHVTVYTPDIERLNIWTHVVGILYGALGSYPLISRSMQMPEMVWSVSIYIAGFMMTFITSTLYHAAKEPSLKWKLKTADHISIYFMIAGSYTPFVMAYLKTQQGFLLLTVMWILSFLGILFKIYTTGRLRVLSTSIYVLMGMAIVLLSDDFFSRCPKDVSILILIGGLSYLIGVIFYLRKSWYYHHPIWHVFVLIGAVSHWWAVWLIF